MPPNLWNVAQAQAPAERTQVPMILGMAAADAKRTVEAAGLFPEFQIGPAAPAVSLRLTVKESSPAASTQTTRGGMVQITLYANEVAPATEVMTSPGRVPPLLGMSSQKIRDTLAARGYAVQFYLGPNPTAPDYTLTAYYQKPDAGQELKAGATVHVGLYSPPGAAVSGVPPIGSAPSAPAAPSPTSVSGPGLVGVFAEPLLDQHNERVDPRGGLLCAEQLDMQVPAGPLSLEVRRYLQLDPHQGGLLGGAWRLNWEKHLFLHDGGAALLEKEGWLHFRPQGSAGKFLSAQGDLLVVDASSAQCFRPDNTCETYDGAGRLAQVDANNGNVVHLQYDAAGRLSRVEGPFGSYLSLVTDQSGRLVQIGSSSGATVRYFYGSPSDVPAEARVRFGYDAKGRLTSLLHPQDGKTEFEYDAENRVLTRRFADGAAERWEYDEGAGIRRHTDTSGARSVFRFDPSGRNVEIETPLGHRSRIEMDDWGRPVTIVGTDGRQAQLTFDTLGRLTEVTRTGEGSQRFEYYRDTPVVIASTGLDGNRVLRQYDLQRNLLSVAHDKDDAKDAQFEYLPNGLLQRAVHRGGRTFTFAYDDRGRVISLTDVAGNVATFEYDAFGRLLRWVDPLGRATTNNFDRDGRLISCSDASGAAARYQYDDAGRLVQSLDASGGATRFEYDARGRRTARTDPLGRTQRWTYDGAGQLMSETDAAGATTRYEYDADGNRVRRVNAVGGAVVRTFNALGQTVSERDAAGGTTQFEYAPSGRLASRIGPDGGKTTFQYDPVGQIIAETDRFGRATRYEYDIHGNLTQTVPAAGPTVTRQYDNGDQLVAVLEDGKPIARYEYDAAGNRTKENFATGREVTYERDAEGRVTAWRDNLGGSGSTRYDLNGRPLEVTDATGAKVRYRYDLAGRLLGQTDSFGNVEHRKYDAAGQLTALTDAAGRLAGYEYDAAGRLAKVARPGGGEQRYEYDLLGNSIQATDPLGNVVRSQYDSAGRLVSKTDARGQTTTYVYDAANRIAEKRLDDGQVVSYRYDRAGNLQEIDDGEFPVRYQYDEQGRRTRLEYPAIKRWLAYEYDPRGRLTVLTDSDGAKIEYEYDAHNRLAGIRSGNAQTRIAYDASGRRSGVTYPNGVTCSREFDAAGRIFKLSYTSPDKQPLAAWSYAYDAVGRLTEATASTGKKVQYQYDAGGQLIECRNDGEVTQYRYGPGGNWESRKSGETNVKYRSDKADRIVAAGDEQLRYDENGNLVERKSDDRTTRYQYGAENRLVAVALPDGRKVSFGYAPTGERIWREDEKGRTWFVNDGLNLVAELDGQLKLQARYLHGPGIDDVLSMQQGDDVFCLHADPLGSVSWITDSAGRLAAERAFDVFGMPRVKPGGPDCRFAFTGREYDTAIGLYYYRARYYDPQLGRFLSPDPTVPSQDDLLSLNPYQYAQNSPTNLKDPLGTGWRADSIARELAEKQNYGMPAKAVLKSVMKQQEFLRDMLNYIYQGVDISGVGYSSNAGQAVQEVEDDMRALSKLQASYENQLRNPPPTAPVEAPTPPETPASSVPPEGNLPASEPPVAEPTVPSEPPVTQPTTPTEPPMVEPTVPAETPGSYPIGPRPPTSVGFGGNVWRNLKSNLGSPLARAGIGLGVAMVIYDTATAHPGHGANTLATGVSGLGGSLLGGAVGVALLGSNPAGWALFGVGLLGSYLGGRLGGSIGNYLVPAPHAHDPVTGTDVPSSGSGTSGSSAPPGVAASANYISTLEDNLKPRSPSTASPPATTTAEKTPPKQPAPPATTAPKPAPRPAWYFNGIPMYYPPGARPTPPQPRR